jgi:hypothetical protein
MKTGVAAAGRNASLHAETCVEPEPERLFPGSEDFLFSKWLWGGKNLKKYSGILRGSRASPGI